MVLKENRTASSGIGEGQVAFYWARNPNRELTLYLKIHANLIQYSYIKFSRKHSIAN